MTTEPAVAACQTLWPTLAQCIIPLLAGIVGVILGAWIARRGIGAERQMLAYSRLCGHLDRVIQAFRDETDDGKKRRRETVGRQAKWLKEYADENTFLTGHSLQKRINDLVQNQLCSWLSDARPDGVTVVEECRHLKTEIENAIVKRYGLKHLNFDR